MYDFVLVLDPTYKVGWVSSSDRAVSDHLEPVQRKITCSEAAKSTSVGTLHTKDNSPVIGRPCKQCSDWSV